MKRLISLLLALALATLAAAAGPKPKLILAIVIDQFRYDYLLRFRADYHDGLDRLLTHGAVFTDAHYPQAATVTAVGHSTFLTGAPPAMSGIIANAWYDRESASMVTSVSDPRTTLVGAPGTHPGSSPRRLLVSTVGDELKMSGWDSHVVSVSIKDRSAILPGGHRTGSPARFTSRAEPYWRSIRARSRSALARSRKAPTCTANSAAGTRSGSLITSIRTFAVPGPIMSMATAAAWDRSMIRPSTNGPRSLIRTSIDFWFSRLVTRTTVSKGSVRWAAVSFSMS